MITIKSFVFNPIQVNTYVLHDETGECIIIDPGVYNKEEKRELTEYIAANHLNPTKLLNTHYHFDHILGNKFVSETYKVSIEGHSSLKELLKGYDIRKVTEMFGIKIDIPPAITNYLEDGDIVSFGNSKLKILHVPGHSPESIVFYSDEQKFAIVGDVLFEGSIGRTDLPGGDYNTLIHYISEKLMALDDNVKVYSGHGNNTTIGRERKFNPFLT